MVFSQYVKLASVEDYSCVTSFYLDSWFSFTHLHIFQGPVARSMVSVNQRLIPWQRIGFDTA